MRLVDVGAASLGAAGEVPPAGLLRALYRRLTRRWQALEQGW